MRMFNPPHPGEVLRDYLGGVSVTDSAKHLRVTRVALSRILNGSAGISAEMALRLSDALGTPPAANHPWKRGCRDMPERPVWAAR